MQTRNLQRVARWKARSAAIFIATIFSFFLSENALQAHPNNDKLEPTIEVRDCSKGIAIPRIGMGGAAINDIDTFFLCKDQITGMTDIEFDVVSVVDFNTLQTPRTGYTYFLRYIINSVSVSDPNVSSITGGDVVSTNFSSGTIPGPFDGATMSALNITIQDDIALMTSNDLLQCAHIKYEIITQIMEGNGVDTIVSAACFPTRHTINVKVCPNPTVEAIISSATSPTDTSACENQPISLVANVINGQSNIQSYSWAVVDSDPGFSGTFTDEFASNTTFNGTIDNSIINKGECGTVTAEVTFSNANGCSGKDSIVIRLCRAAGALSCNDNINISLDEDCEVTILPDDVLEGSYGDFDLFDVMIFHGSASIGNMVNGSHIGQNLTVRVIDQCSGNYCWGNLNVEDKFAPVINCQANPYKTSLISSSLTATDPTFNRTIDFVQGTASGFCALSGASTNVHYEATPFSVATAGVYNFEMVVAGIDLGGAIYSDPFNPTNPCQNLITADDNGGALTNAPRLSANLAAGNYILVTSATNNGATGGYQWNISSPISSSTGLPTGICMIADTITLPCSVDLSTIPSPVATDNCEGNITPMLVDETSVNFGCGRADGTVQIIERSWRAVDSKGNESATCKQIIKLVRQPLLTVIFPPDFDDVTKPALSCTQPMSAAHPDFTGYPQLDGYPILTGNTCMFNLEHEDLILPDCGSGKKILREWTVLDWCAPLQAGVNPATHIQVIKFLDSYAPDFVCVDDFTAGAHDGSSNAHGNCTATVNFPPIVATDSCSGVDVQIITNYGIVNGNGGTLSGFPIGEHDIKYVMRDSCGNDTSCVTKLTVIDDLEPVAICIDLLDVALTSTGTATVNATSFDAGSYDNCCFDRFEVKPMRGGRFGPTITFDCDDIGIVMVRVKVFDCFGNENECMVEVEVEDKLRPTLICPPTATIGCTDDPNDLTLTGGNATSNDVCASDPVTHTDNPTLDMCGVGRIVRTFTQTDDNGNTGTCRQIINVVNNNPFDPTTIVWPRDTMFFNDCGRGLHPDSLPTGYDYPTYDDNFCADLYSNYKDMQFDRVQGACFKIRRLWTIIDWCTYNSNNPLSTGKWEYTQEIAVIDNQAPIVDCPDSLEFSAGYNCVADIEFDTLVVISDCSNNYTHSVSGDFNSFGPITGVPLGRYNVNINVMDGCGNTAVCPVPVIVKDMKPPTPVCHDTISVNIDSVMKMVWVKAKVFDASSVDNCTNVSFSFTLNRADSMAIFDCDSLGFVPVRLYVFDENGNSDFCNATLDVQDNKQTCFGSRPLIVGSIKNEQSDPVENIEVAISGANMAPAKTNQTGQFEFRNLSSGGDYSIFPFCDDDFGNGISTYDLVQISKHVLNVELIDSPYKLIAADANNSQNISTLDIVALRKLVLHVANDLPNNTSWRFVKSDYTFPDPTNPWEEQFPEIQNLNDVRSGTHYANFTAIKIGDLNGDADMSNVGEVDERTYHEALTFTVNNQSFEKGTAVKVDFTSADFRQILGYQSTIQFDTRMFELTEILPGAITSEESFGQAHLPKGKLTTSWYSAKAESFDDETVLFSLVFKALQTGNVANNIWMDGSLTRAESYTASGDIKGVDLEVMDVISEVRLYQNEPNPFSDKTTIRFYLPESAEISLTITDISGKEVKKYIEKYEAGTHSIELQKADLPSQSVLFYRLQTTDFSGVKKMLLIE